MKMYGKGKWMTLPMLSSLLVSGVAGCGPEVVALTTAVVQLAPLFGVVGGAVLLLQNIENVSLDTAKKRLEVQALEGGVREVHTVDLTDDQVRDIERSRAVRIGDQQYHVD
jgi:hypothetical protein